MLKNTIANFFGKFWSIFSVFIFIPLYIDYLGFEAYSIISFTLILAGLMGILDSGLTATLSREFARGDNTGIDKGETLKTLEVIYFGIVFVLILIISFFSNYIASNWIKTDFFQLQELSFFVRLVSIDFGLQMLFRFYLGGLLGMEKQVVANKIQIFWGVMRNGIVVAVIFFYPTLDSFFVWQAFSTFLFVLLIRITINKYIDPRTSKGIYIKKSVIQGVWRFAGGMMLISLVAGLNSQLDKIAISKLLSIESLGYYTLAFSMSMGVLTIVSPISVAILPRFTKLYSNGKKKDAINLFGVINLLVMIIAFSFMANMIFFSKELLWVWTGKIELAENAQFYLPIIAVSFAMLAVALIPYNIAIANGYTRLNNWLGLVSLIVTIPGYWLATKNYGGIGAAAMFCVTQVIITLVYIFFINKKFLGIKLELLFIQRILLPFITTIGFAFGLSKIFPSNFDSRIIMFFWIGLSTFITLLGTFLIFVRGDAFVSVKKILSFDKVKEKLTNG